MAESFPDYILKIVNLELIFGLSKEIFVQKIGLKNKQLNKT